MNPVALREILKEIKDRHQLGDYGGKSPHDVETLEFCLLELESRLPRWIPIEERLPEKWMKVITYNKEDGTICNAWVSKDGEWYDEADLLTGITHWMPQPKGPEE
jgi:Protein of unknown function (DUF551).